LVIYDIFGFFPQTLQGADILAHSDEEHQFQVFMPDWFEGSPADISWYPPDTDEKGKKLGEFFQTAAAPPKTVERVKKVMSELQSQNPGIKEWGVVGYCWGGKVCHSSFLVVGIVSVVFSINPARSSTWSLSPEHLSRPPPYATLPWSTRMTPPRSRSHCSRSLREKRTSRRSTSMKRT
jgi:hypothetical protein